MILISQIPMITPGGITGKTFSGKFCQVFLRHHFPHTFHLRRTDGACLRIKRMRTESKEPFRLLNTVRAVAVIAQQVAGKEGVGRIADEQAFGIKLREDFFFQLLVDVFSQRPFVSSTPKTKARMVTYHFDLVFYRGDKKIMIVGIFPTTFAGVHLHRVFPGTVTIAAAP